MLLLQIKCHDYISIEINRCDWSILKWQYIYSFQRLKKTKKGRESEREREIKNEKERTRSTYRYWEQYLTIWSPFEFASYTKRTFVAFQILFYLVTPKIQPMSIRKQHKTKPKPTTTTKLRIKSLLPPFDNQRLSSSCSGNSTNSTGKTILQFKWATY